MPSAFPLLLCCRCRHLAAAPRPRHAVGGMLLHIRVQRFRVPGAPSYRSLLFVLLRLIGYEDIPLSRCHPLTLSDPYIPRCLLIGPSSLCLYCAVVLRQEGAGSVWSYPSLLSSWLPLHGIGYCTAPPASTCTLSVLLPVVLWPSSTCM